MNYFYKNTKIGCLTIVEENSKIIKIDFGKKEYKGNFINSKPIEKAFFELEEYFSGKRKTFNINYELFGTPFQKKVWEELKNIPYGKTVSYQYIAQKIGNKNAQRAIGSANNKNPLPFIIPCHRVIKSNGDIGGYSGADEIKSKLLLIEKLNK